MHDSGIAKALAAFMFTVAAIAQHREPFTGVVRDAAGQPIGNAQVVCDWQPDGIVPGTPDRHETKTDAEGRFALDLWIGHAYCVWGIGPVGADERRHVIAPTFAAVGGKNLDLVAHLAPATPRLRVRGSLAWLDAGPLALRIHVTATSALPDLLFPGDGDVPLPPLPATSIAVCLVDRRGEVVDCQSVDLSESMECTFAPSEEIEFTTNDDDGKPVAGASVFTQCWVSHPVAPLLLQQAGAQVRHRLVATSDAKGRARGRIARSPRATMTLFRATTANAASTLSGWWTDHRIVDGAPSDDDPGRPVTLTLRRLDATSVRVRGRADDLRLHTRWTGNQEFGSATMSASLPMTTTSSLLTGDVATAIVFSANIVRVDLGGTDDGSLPMRAFARSAGKIGQLADIDLDQLRRLRVTTVDEHGKPSPFTVVGLTQGLRGLPVYWLSYVVTDREGRAELRCPPESTELYATTDDGHGYASAEGTGATDVRITVQPFATALVQVVDTAGKPVAGARLQATRHTVHQDEGISRLVQGRHDPIADAVTDARGQAVVRIPRELDGNTDIAARLAGKLSASGRLRAGRGDPLLLRFPD